MPKLKMKSITIWVPERWLKALDDLVKAGYYSSRGEAIRTAIRDLLYQDLQRLDSETDRWWSGDHE